jgi:hypothetical protein
VERTTRISSHARTSRTSRTSRLARIGGAAGAAMIALAACGPLRLGAAATYGNQRISQASLASEVTNLTTAYQAAKSKVNPQYAPADMPRKVLTWMLTFATFNQVAAAQNIHVTAAQVQQEAAGLQSGVKQNGLTLQEAAVGAGLPPDLLPAYETFAVQESLLGKKLGNPTTQAGQTALQQRVGQMVCHAAKALSISVNPQYGALEYKTLQVLATASTLTAPAGGTTLPLANAARFKPAC